MLSHSASCSGSALHHDSAIDSTIEAENLAIDPKLLGQLENLERSQNFPALKKNHQPLKNAAKMAQFASPVTEETYSEAGKKVVDQRIRSSVATLFCKHSMPGLRNETKGCTSSDHVPSGILTRWGCMQVRVLEVQKTVKLTI